MKTARTVYDISVMLGQESVDYPGDAPYSREVMCAIRDGASFELSRLVMSAHSGTHIDFPAHFIQSGKTQDRCDISDFILSARVVEIKDTETIRPAEIQHLDINPNEALLFKTENSRRGLCNSGKFSDSYVYLSPEAAELCVDKRVSLIGIDYITIDKYGDETFPAHRKVLGNNILVLEGIDLSNVPPGTYTLICPPLHIKGGEASPVRAVLLREEGVQVSPTC